MMRELSSSPEPEEFEEAETELLSSEEQKPVSNSKKRKSKNKRRFSNEQVRSLEAIFESETKLDPRKKVQVARDLGLQPRQVAIWFQNKRARWKSKEIEKNYRALKANYDSLKAKFDATKKEKESLLLQLQELQNQLQNMQGGEGSEDSAGDRIEQNMDNIGGHVLESCMLEEELECREVRCFDDDHRSRNITCMGQGDGPQLLDMNEHMHTSLTAQAKWCSLDPGSLFDQHSSVSHWWDSWT